MTEYIAPDEIRNPDPGYVTYYLDGDRYRDDAGDTISVSGMLGPGFKHPGDQYVYYTKPTSDETHLVSVLDDDGDRWTWNDDESRWESPTNQGEPLLNPQYERDLTVIEDDYKVKEYVYSEPVPEETKLQAMARQLGEVNGEAIKSAAEAIKNVGVALQDKPQPGDTVWVEYEAVYDSLVHWFGEPEHRVEGTDGTRSVPADAKITVIRRAQPETPNYRGVAFPEGGFANDDLNEAWQAGVDAAMDAAKEA